MGLSLSEADLASIEAALSTAAGPSGPVYGLERDREGAHGEVMKYNLNCLNQAKHLEELCTRSVNIVRQTFFFSSVLVLD